MDSIKKDYYEELIANNRFVLWASGENENDQPYWETWNKEHPDAIFEFNEAYKTVEILKFKSPEISSEEVSELWFNAKNKMKLRLPARSSANLAFWYGRIAGVLIIPFLIASIWFFYSNQHLKNDVIRISEYNSSKLLHVVSPLGGQLDFELPDGSKVWLNSGSEIKYPACFESGQREVEMSGEVYFQIAKSQIPFIVKNLGPTIKVYGTEFNVHAYADEDNVTVALVNGKISLDKGSGEAFLKPGEVSSFDKLNRTLAINESDIYQYTCWREGKYIFRDMPFGLILKMLQRKYNVNIQLNDPELASFKYNAMFNGESLEQILELMTLSAPIQYDYKKQTLKKDGTYTKAEVILSRDKSKIFNQKK